MQQLTVLLYFTLLLLALLPGCSAQSLPEMDITVGGHTLTVEIAATPEERTKGLMYRKQLPENRGMLFVFEKEHQPSFWMKNTYIPLSIAFISADGHIRQIENMQPDSLATVTSERNVLYALEVNQGWFEKHGIQEGEVLEGKLTPWQ